MQFRQYGDANQFYRELADVLSRLDETTWEWSSDGVIRSAQDEVVWFDASRSKRVLVEAVTPSALSKFAPSEWRHLMHHINFGMQRTVEQAATEIKRRLLPLYRLRQDGVRRAIENGSY
jgi:hypothetical protein